MVINSSGQNNTNQFAPGPQSTNFGPQPTNFQMPQNGIQFDPFPYIQPGTVTSNPNDAPGAFGPNQPVGQLSPESQAFNQQIANLAPGELMPGEGGVEVMPQPVNNTGMVSSTPVQQEFNSASNQLNDLAVQEDPYMQLFEQMNEANAQDESNAIASATAAGANEQNALQSSQQQYMGRLETAGIQSGRSRYLREQTAGIMESARQSYISKFMQIDKAEKLAIAEAEAARYAGDVRNMQQQLDYINELRSSKAKALSEANKLAWEKEKFDRKMEQDENEFNRSMALSWTKYNDKSGDEDEDNLGPQTLSFSKKKGKKLSRKLGDVGVEVKQSLIDNLILGLNSGAELEEVIADLTLEEQSLLTPKVLNIIKEAVQ